MNEKLSPFRFGDLRRLASLEDMNAIIRRTNLLLRTIALRPLVLVKSDAGFLLCDERALRKVKPDANAALIPRGLLVNGPVYALKIDGSGKLLIGGAFTEVSGTEQRGIARIVITSSMSHDTSLVTSPGITDPTSATAFVRSIGLTSGGKIFINGDFQTYDGNSTFKIARLNSDGSYDSSFVVNTSTQVGTRTFLALDGSDEPYVSDNYGGGENYNGNTIPMLFRINTDGTFDSGFDILGNLPGGGVFPPVSSGDQYMPGGGGNFVKIANSGKIYLVGGVNIYESEGGFDFFTAYDGVIRFETDGAVDSTFHYGQNEDMFGGFTPFCLAEYDDGKILVGGDFDEVNGSAAAYVVRLNSDGSTDGTFASALGTSLGESYVKDIKILDSGKILIAGHIEVSGQLYNLVRLNSDGSVDMTYGDPGAEASGAAIEIDADGNYILGGSFTEATMPTPYLCRFAPDGTHVP